MSDSFEDEMQKIENIVEELERGDLALDVSMKKFQEGIKIINKLDSSLDKYEKKLKVLMSDKNGDYTIEDFSEHEKQDGSETLKEFKNKHSKTPGKLKKPESDKDNMDLGLF